VSLPSTDTAYLSERGTEHAVSQEGGMICVLLPGFPLPAGYDRPRADLLLRLSPGYPDVPPDMWWFDPPVTLNNGTSLPATEVRETHLGRTWQRWSRHFDKGQWRSGVDCLETFLALIRKELSRGVGQVQ
jgi:hypothetical protein